MNSKFILFIFILSLFAACGVKGPPAKYPETIVDSYTRSYTGADPTPEEIERTKEKEPVSGAQAPIIPVIPTTPPKK